MQADRFGLSAARSVRTFYPGKQVILGVCAASLTLSALPAMGPSSLVLADGTGGGSETSTILAWQYPLIPLIGGALGSTEGLLAAVVGDLATAIPSSVFLLPLDPMNMTLDDWAVLGVSPAQAVEILAAWQSGQSMYAVVNVSGDVVSIIGTTQAVATNPGDAIMVNGGTATNPNQTVEDMLRELRRLLEELRRRLYGPQPPPPPPPPGGPGEGDPEGEW